MPDQSPELTALELPHIKAALLASITEIDNIKSRVDATRQSIDVDKLFHVRHVSLQQEKQTHWHLIMAIISCTFTFLLNIYFSFPFKLHHFVLRCFRKKYPSRTKKCVCTFILKHSYIWVHKGSYRNGCTQGKL